MTNSKKEKKAPIYTKTINKENVDKMPYKEIRRFIWRDFFAVTLSQIAGVLATLCGYNFQDTLTIYTFGFEMAFLLIAVVLYIFQYRAARKYKVFKKELFFWVLISLNFLLVLGEFISAYFNMSYALDPNDSTLWIVRINPVYYLFIFLLLFIFYFFLVDVIYMKGFRIASKTNDEEKMYKEEIKMFNKGYTREDLTSDEELRFEIKYSTDEDIEE